MCTNLRYQNHVLLENSVNILQLDPAGQLEILREYQRLNPNDPCLKHIVHLTKEKLLEYIRKHSEGEDIGTRTIDTPKPGL